MQQRSLARGPVRTGRLPGGTHNRERVAPVTAQIRGDRGPREGEPQVETGRVLKDVATPRSDTAAVEQRLKDGRQVVRVRGGGAADVDPPVEVAGHCQRVLLADLHREAEGARVLANHVRRSGAQLDTDGAPAARCSFETEGAGAGIKIEKEPRWDERERIEEGFPHPRRGRGRDTRWGLERAAAGAAADDPGSTHAPGYAAAVACVAVIRSLAPDELPWFLARAFAFVGHGDPWGLAQRLAPRLRSPRRDAADAWVWLPEGPEGTAEPTAGAVVRPNPWLQEDPTVHLALPWFAGDDPSPFVALISALLQRAPQEAAEIDLAALDAVRREALGAALGPLGFCADQRHTLHFHLADTPPLGRPLVLEGWRLERDAPFRTFVAEAEGTPIGDRRWAFMKRAAGTFTPEMWTLAFETLDQPPVGYALGARERAGFDGIWRLSALGVGQPWRATTEMLRRLVLTLLHDWAAQSPLGRVEAQLWGEDPKLIAILRSVGFEVRERVSVLRRVPG
jgi:hypothetical protein